MTRSLVACLVFAVAAPVAAAPFSASGIADWTRPPAPGPEPVFVPPVAQRSRLDNGISVLVVENHTLPIVSVELLVTGAGAAADPKRRGGLAALTADLLDEGAGGLSALALAEEKARLGARIGTGISTDAAHLSANTLAGTVEPTLELIAKIATQPALAADELARVKGDRLTALAQLRDQPTEVAAIVLQQALFGIDSGYGHREIGLRAEVAAITAADVRAFYRARWVPAAMTVIVVGDVDPRAIQARLAATLGAWRAPVTAAAAATRPVSTPPAAPRRLLLVDRPGAAQSNVDFGLIGPDRHDPRYHAFEVLRTIVGGGFTGRVTQRLREQLGIIYHAYTEMRWQRAPGPFSIEAAIATPETATGIAEVIKILRDLETQEVSAEELDKAKQNLIRALPTAFSTNAATADAFADLALHELPDDTYARFADEIRRVTAADVKAAARALLPSGKLVVSVVGDVAKVRASLATLGLGPPARYDLDAMPAR